MASLDTFIPQKCVKMLLVLVVGILIGAFLSFGFLGALGTLPRPAVLETLFAKYENTKKKKRVLDLILQVAVSNTPNQAFLRSKI